mmetsp:Transcript_6008/g.21202  ORF Transcript_6008/g.21202 Transcript_6008/m.21202 type:complete len:133 (+) Transcript_6008:1210-1608(+)
MRGRKRKRDLWVPCFTFEDSGEDELVVTARPTSLANAITLTSGLTAMGRGHLHRVPERGNNPNVIQDVEAVSKISPLLQITVRSWISLSLACKEGHTVELAWFRRRSTQTADGLAVSLPVTSCETSDGRESE